MTVLEAVRSHPGRSARGYEGITDSVERLVLAELRRLEAEGKVRRDERGRWEIKQRGNR